MTASSGEPSDPLFSANEILAFLNWLLSVIKHDFTHDKDNANEFVKIFVGMILSCHSNNMSLWFMYKHSLLKECSKLLI